MTTTISNSPNATIQDINIPKEKSSLYFTNEKIKECALIALGTIANVTSA